MERSIMRIESQARGAAQHPTRRRRSNVALIASGDTQEEPIRREAQNFGLSV